LLDTGNTIGPGVTGVMIQINGNRQRSDLNTGHSNKEMMRKKIVVLFIAVVGVLTMNFRCEKDVTARPFDFTFEIPVDIYPLKKAYSLNDTIWLETDITGKILYDSKTGQNIPVDSGMITFWASFNPFGTSITNPVNGFCDVTGTSGGNISRDLRHWVPVVT
jgi:hypothetical protein